MMNLADIVKIVTILVTLLLKNVWSSDIWQDFEPGVRESTGCDFPLSDIQQTHSISLEDCRSGCLFQKFGQFKCTHYVWNPNYKNGTCFFKSGSVSEATTQRLVPHNPNAKCGFLTILWKYSSKDDVWWSFNCKYIIGTDLKSQESKGDECGTLYQQNPKCTHFNVSVFQNITTCVMKSGHATKNNAEKDLNMEIGSLCGFRSTPIPSTTSIIDRDDDNCECIC